MNLSLNNETLKILQGLYPKANLILEKIEYSGLISVFFAYYDSAEGLNLEWKNISNSVAGYYQPYLDNDFEKWNIYLLYLCKEEIPLTLKYQIENDRFSSRKIVVDDFKEKLDEKNIENIISNHVTNTDLLCVPEEKKDSDSSVYSSNSIVWELITDIITNKSKVNKKEMENITESLLEQIENKLKHEI